MNIDPVLPATDPEDDALVEAVRAGDADAFAALLDRHLPAVRTFLALRAPAAQLVDEVAHDTFVFAYRRLEDFKPGTSFRAWVRAVAWNLLRAEVQRFAREQQNRDRLAAWHTDIALDETADTEPPEEAEHLQDCLGELPAAQRDLVLLKYREERSTEEIAARLERSLVWVRVTLFRVRQQLRDCIEGKAKGIQPC